MKDIVALQTAKFASSGVPGKNTKQTHGKPLFAHNLLTAIDVTTIDQVFCLTDIPGARDLVPSGRVEVLDLPADVAIANHYDAIIYGLSEIEKRRGSECDIVVVLLGNSYGLESDDLEVAISRLVHDSNLDSVCSVSSFNCFNPVRAWSIVDNRLVSALPFDQLLTRKSPTNERATLGDIYFFNGSFWVIRRDVLVANDGAPPFPWLGRNISAFPQSSRFELDHSWQIPFFENLHWDDLHPETDDEST